MCLYVETGVSVLVLWVSACVDNRSVNVEGQMVGLWRETGVCV